MTDQWIVRAAAIVMLLLWAALFGAIFRKAGYSFWLGLLMVVPVVSLIWLVIFAASEWPIQRELKGRRALGFDGAADDFEALLAEASRIERRGDWEHALQLYEQAAASPTNPNPQYAANCAAAVRRRLANAATGGTPEG